MTRPSPATPRPEEPCACRRVLARLRPTLVEHEQAFLDVRLHRWATGGRASCDPTEAERLVVAFRTDSARLIELWPPAGDGAWHAERRRIRRQAEGRSLPPERMAKCVVKAGMEAIEDFTPRSSLDAWFDALLVRCLNRWLKEAAPYTDRDRVPPVTAGPERLGVVRAALDRWAEDTP